MQFDSYRRRTPTINLSALIDVLFILIVFVMLAASFDRIGALDIEGPGSEMTSRPASDAIELEVPTRGPMRLLGVPIGADDLTAKLRAARGDRTSLILVADGEVALARVTRILGAAAAAGFTSVAIAARSEKGSRP